MMVKSFLVCHPLYQRNDLLARLLGIGKWKNNFKMRIIPIDK
jgi:hypothetical protein